MPDLDAIHGDEKAEGRDDDGQAQSAEYQKIAPGKAVCGYTGEGRRDEHDGTHEERDASEHRA